MPALIDRRLQRHLSIRSPRYWQDEGLHTSCWRIHPSFSTACLTQGFCQSTLLRSLQSRSATTTGCFEGKIQHSHFGGTFTWSDPTARHLANLPTGWWTVHDCALPILWPAYAAATISYSLMLQTSMSDSFSGFLREMTYDTNTLPFVLPLTRRWRPFIMVLWLSFPYLLYSQAIVAIIFLQKIASWLGEPLGIPA